MTSDTIVEIPLDHLRDSPFNPRRSYTDIDELAASIQAEGRIHQPLLVRPISGGGLLEDDVQAYEVVFGHRRKRGAVQAGLLTAPCVIRALTDAEARSAQVAENLSRKDVHPFEEAEGYATMLEHDGLTQVQLAERFGKSPSYITARLKLLQAIPRVRDACLAGEFGAEVALLIARMRTHTLQEKALHRIKAQALDMEDGGQQSYRRIRDLLAEEFTLQLKGAIFDREDATLIPEAGACSACPKRAGNALEFADVATHERAKHQWRPFGGADACTDPDCWAAKKTAHLARAAAAQEAAGHTVVTGNKARAAIAADGTVKGAYAPADKAVAKALKAASIVPPKVVLIQNPRDGKTVKAYRRDDLVQAGLEGFAAPAKGSKPAAPSWQEEEQRRHKQAEKEAAAAAETQRRRAVLDQVRERLKHQPRTALQLALIAEAAVRGVPYEDKQMLLDLHGIDNEPDLIARLRHMGPDDLALLLLDCALVADVEASPYGDTYPAALVEVAAEVGVEVGELEPQAGAGGMAGG
jgi:ParB/RepB/Spo0J family partition protein